MEANYSFDESLLRLQVWGEVRADALIKLMGTIGADPRHHPAMPAVADFREANADWDYCEIQRFRDYVALLKDGAECRWAAVVRPGALAAVAHVAIVISEAAASRIRMQLFDEPRAAVRWAKSGESQLSLTL